MKIMQKQGRQGDVLLTVVDAKAAGAEVELADAEGLPIFHAETDLVLWVAARIERQAAELERQAEGMRL
jgi:hypothetical protein